MNLLIYTGILICLRLAKSSPIILPGPSGKVTSPGYPSPYADNFKQEWSITADPGHVVAMKFTTFELEHSFDDETGPCAYDYVKVIDGDNTVLYNLCGSASMREYDAPNTEQWYKSKTNKVTIKFASDYSNEEEFVGFEANYKTEELDECTILKAKAESSIDDWDEVLYCSQDCHNTPGSYYCSCKDGYTLHANKHTCTPNCDNKVLTADSGVISSPEYPNDYPKLASCEWTIDVGVGRTINLEFSSPFNIEDHFEEGCVYDWLEITKNGEIQKLCGNVVPTDPRLLKTQANKVGIKFVSDLTLENPGFKLTYKTTRASCKESLHAINHGRISKGQRSKYEFEDEVEFSCDVGYTLEGSQKIKCLHHGRWSDLQPRCKIVSCGVPPHKDIANSEIINFNLKEWTYEEEFTIKCNDWYILDSVSKTWRCGHDGTWKSVGSSSDADDMPVCKPECGIPGKVQFFTSLLSGGKRADKHEFPWMTLVTLQKKIDGSQFCGGSLISPTHVLTAAHCVVQCFTQPSLLCVRTSPEEVHTWFKVHNRKEDQQQQSNIVYSAVQQIFSHEQYYKPSQWNNDIAVLKLKTSLAMTEHVHPICLPSVAYEFGLVDKLTSTGHLAGWGIYKQSVVSDILVKAEFQIQPDQTVCWDESMKILNQLSAEKNKKFKIPKESLVTDNMFCAKSLNTDAVSNACRGDSGGALMMKRKPEAGKQVSKMFVAGLVSFGVTDIACEAKASYTVFTRLNVKLTNWVTQKMKIE